MIEKMRSTHGHGRALRRTVGRMLAAGMMATWLAAPLSAAETKADSGQAPAEPVAAASAAQAAPGKVDDATQTAIRNGLQRLMAGNSGMKIEEIRPTPIPGLYEVQVGQILVYADGAGKYVLAEGELIDIENQRNLTRERATELSRIDFKRDLPLDKAIKQVHGNGKRVLAIFEDPNCSYCRRMRSVLAGIDDLTIYTFTYPILAPSSLTKSQKAWCAKDPSAAWADLMSNGKEPDNAGDCKTPVQEVLALGRKLNVTGTPTLFFPDGNRVPGAISPEQLEQLLDAQGKATAKKG